VRRGAQKSLRVTSGLVAYADGDSQKRKALEAKLRKESEALRKKLDNAEERNDYDAAAAIQKQLDETPERKLKAAVERGDDEAAAEIIAQLNEAAGIKERKPVSSNVSDGSLLAALNKRASELGSRKEKILREREHIKNLGEMWPLCEAAQKAIWDHWFAERGDEARAELLAADGDAAKLISLIEQYPDWAEPTNRLATLRFLEGEYADSAALCKQVLREKPWHFGASSGIVQCYVKLEKQGKAQRFAEDALPQPGPKRQLWVERMLVEVDTKLAALEGFQK
jgi:hypothetical protein